MSRVVILCVWILVNQSSASLAAPADEAKPKLEGSWIVTSASWGGKPLEGFEKDRTITLTFSGEKFVYMSSGYKDTEKGAESQEGEFKLDVGKLPKYLDLIVTKGDVVGTQKCIIALEKDELKVAFTLSFVPGTPEQELRETKRTMAIRPKSFEAKPDDLVFILVLKRKPK